MARGGTLDVRKISERGIEWVDERIASAEGCSFR